MVWAGRHKRALAVLWFIAVFIAQGLGLLGPVDREVVGTR